MEAIVIIIYSFGIVVVMWYGSERSDASAGKVVGLAKLVETVGSESGPNSAE